MKKYVLLFALISNVSSASSEDIETKVIEIPKETKSFDCVAELMSKPSCINRLNANKACSVFGNSKETVTMIQKCVTEEGFDAGVKTMAPRNIMVVCLGGRVSGSSNVKDNETFCHAEEGKNSLSISDTTLPKKVDTGTDTNIKSSAVAK